MPDVSVYLLAPAVAWVSAQVLKYLFHVLKTKRYLELSPLYMSGNMPSAHSATMVALTVAVGYGEGYQSAEFAIALIVSCIVIYDALQVRRAVGEQGHAVEKLLNKAKMNLRPYQALGHTPLEVTIGALVGTLAAVLTLIF